MSIRGQRKLDHVRLALAAEPCAGLGGLLAPGWEEVHLINCSLPEQSFEQVKLSVELAGVPLAYPVIINAMTGGAPEVTGLNRELAHIAAGLDLAMAVGSQTAALQDSAVADTYKVVRSVHKKGVLLANVGADTTLADAQRAIEMVEANLLQVHLNAPQEMVMTEGDRDFRGQLEQIGRLVRAASVPVVVKECGFGLSRESIGRLYQVGVRAVDISGRGGTNFAWIEAQRRQFELDPGLLCWGIPTAAALAEASELQLPGLQVIGSGGIVHGSDAVKAFALGAVAVGLAGPVLRKLHQEGPAGLTRYLQNVLRDIAAIMLLCGASSVTEMTSRPVVITGGIAQWCQLRGVNLSALASRA